MIAKKSFHPSLASRHHSVPSLMRVYRSFVLILALLISGWQPWLQSAEKLTSDHVAMLIPRLFELHLSQREMDGQFMKRQLKEFVNQLDAGNRYFLKEEAESIITLGTNELQTLAEQASNGDFSYFTVLVNNFIERQINRDAVFYDGLENRADEIKALLKDPKSQTAVAVKPDDANEDISDDETDKTKRNERPLTHSERETRMLKIIAWQFEINKNYLSEVDALKLALQNIREDRNKWLKIKDDHLIDDEVPKIFLKSFMNAMDPHTDYFDADDDEFTERLERSFAGIGVQIRACPLGAQIDDIIKGGPCDKSGRFARGDQIVAVDSFGLTGLPINKIVKRIKGEKGSEVKLTLLKHDSHQKEIVPLKRDTIELSDLRVKGKKFETAAGTIGLVSVQTFYKGVHGDVRDRINELSKDRPLAGFVLDLRDNQGGYLEEAVCLAGLFLESGDIVGERDGNNKVNWKADPDKAIAYAGPLVILTSQFSASASEIVAGTLKDYNRALIVSHSQTFGKGTVQRVIPLSGLNLPGEVKITTHQYFVAGGASVQLKGVEPDVVIPGPKLFEEMLERASENAVPWNKIPGVINTANPDIKLWNEWKNSNLAALQEKSRQRMEANPELKDFFDPIKRKLKAAELKAALLLNPEKVRNPDEAPPMDIAKKDEKDLQAEEAVAIVQDMNGSWPNIAKQAAENINKVSQKGQANLELNQ